MEGRGISYRRLVEATLETKWALDATMTVLSTETDDWSEPELLKFRRFLQQTFMPKFGDKWRGASRDSNNLERQWGDSRLEKTYIPAEELLEDSPNPEASIEDTVESCRKRGRPSKEFCESSARSQRRKVKETRDTVDAKILQRAAV